MGRVTRKSGVKENQGEMRRDGTPKTIKDGYHNSDSGSKDKELCKAAAGLNSPKKGGLPAN